MCKREGGNLAIIRNKRTRDVVRGFMPKGWIGVSDQWQEGIWQTPLCGPLPYTSWGRGKPYSARYNNRDCAIQYSNKLWKDENCRSKQPFICQFIAARRR